MRLFEAIIDANHRAIAGDANAGVRVVDFENELPVIALTCVDPRLNALFPNVLGLPGDQFIWLRNAGNIIFDTMSSMTRTLSLACAVKGGKEIAIIGHTDCLVCKTTTTQLLERFKNLGIERELLPENLNEFFGLFSSEQQNVIKACDLVRRSSLIGPCVPVHGLLVNTETGKLEWLVNGYQHFETMNRANETAGSARQSLEAMKSFAEFKMGEMKFPETKIGEAGPKGEDLLAKNAGQCETKSPVPPPAIPPPLPKLPLPPRLRPGLRMKPGK